jgi:hypothetical protein
MLFDDSQRCEHFSINFISVWRVSALDIIFGKLLGNNCQQDGA